ncbi:MAG: YeeE/YedE family protein [Betaproteobacteria bacterium]|nr:YeeE/YedE family protein [Betaproteobacteria bacterium]
MPTSTRTLQPGIVGSAGLAAVAVVATVDARKAILFGLGLLLGLTLYHAAFGFAVAYRRLLLERDGSGVQAQLLMIGVTSVLFAPLLANGAAFGQPIGGAVAPVGVSVAVGAFLFGIGMQLGNGCGSGTLFALGGGSPRMLLVLVAFCAGGFRASLDMDFWQSLPDAGPLALGELIGWPPAVALQLAVLLTLSNLVRRYAPMRQRLFTLPEETTRKRWLQGGWPLGIGALLLAVLNLAVLLVAGHPWTITWAYTLWGAKAATLLGWQPAASAFWQGDFQRAALSESLFADATSLMDIGIIIGALLAAGLAERFAPQIRIPPRSLLAALIGGLLMGYGARIAYGCNVGAFFSGIASSSLHGWLWIAAALPGCVAGIALRPYFGLRNT